MREWVVLQNNLGAERNSARKYLIIMVICISLSVIPAYAESAGEGWSGTVVEAGSIIQTLSLTGGAVGLAWCGIEYAYGSEETSRRAKSKAIVIVSAVAAVFALPFFIRLGISVGSQFKWSPRNLG